MVNCVQILWAACVLSAQIIRASLPMNSESVYFSCLYYILEGDSLTGKRMRFKLSGYAFLGHAPFPCLLPAAAHPGPLTRADI